MEQYRTQDRVMGAVSYGGNDGMIGSSSNNPSHYSNFSNNWNPPTVVPYYDGGGGNWSSPSVSVGVTTNIGGPPIVPFVSVSVSRDLDSGNDDGGWNDGDYSSYDDSCGYGYY